MSCVTSFVHLNIQHLLGDNTSFTGMSDTGILNGMFQIEKHAWLSSIVTLIHKYGTPAQKVSVAFQSEVNDSIKQWISRAHKGCRCLSLW